MPPYANDAEVLGIQTPRIRVTPGSALRLPHDNKTVVSLGSEAVDLARHAGLDLDPWQCLALNDMCALQERTYENPLLNEDGEPRLGDEPGRIDNMWATKEFGLVVSRQNGKGSILEARELAGLFLWGERLIVHSAHLFPTALEAFNRILMLIQNTPDLDREIARVTNSHGEEGIKLKSGQRLIFKARTGGNVRGFTGDVIVFDEAMMKLGSAEIKALMPAVSARPNPQLIFTGSAGGQEAEQFGRMRNRALGIKEKPEKFLCFHEYSAEVCTYFCPQNCTEHDKPYAVQTVAKANPALGIRLDIEWIQETEMKSMSLPDFSRERLAVGDWPADGDGWRIISREKWRARSNPESSLQEGVEFAVAIDSASDSSWSCISAAGLNEDDETHAEITGTSDAVDYRPGIKWVVPRLLVICKLYKIPFVVISRESPAATLIDEIESHGITVLSPTVREYAQACGDLKTGIAPMGGEKATITHLGQAELTAAVAGADKKEMQDLWVFSKVLSAVDITPLTCITLAVWGFKKHIFAKVSIPWVEFGA